MQTSSARALGLPAIYELIGIAGEFPAEVKKQELKRPPLKLAEARKHYIRLERLLNLLRGRDAALRVLSELFSQIPKLSLPNAKSSQPYALHELFLIKEFLYHYQKLHAWLRKQGWLDQLILPDLAAVFALLDPEGRGLPSFQISPAYSAKLGELISAQIAIANRLKHARAEYLLEARKELDLPQLKEAFTLSRSETGIADRVLHSPFFVLSAESVANFSFVLADDEICLELRKNLALLQQKREKEENRVLKEISASLNEFLSLLRDATGLLRYSCWLFLLADFALRHGCAIPKLTRRKTIRVKGAVNLPLKLHLEELGRRWQSVDYDFSQAANLLTGPNMGGKTTVLKTAGQLCWLARQGIPLPCAEAEVPLFDNIWYNQSETDSSSDLSSFGKEVVSFSDTLRLEGTTLFLLDEFARGTNPAEGEQLASAVLEHLAASSHMCLAATHFTAPALLESVAHYSIAELDLATLDDRKFASPTQRLKALNEAMDYSLRRLRKNQAPPLSAIRVARILGLPEEILKLTETED
ncbi:MAG: hypothetical protein LHW57_05400 [Candidatus Cloacimonetes bacterium]|nr:hypothetical protein [Candidatus Cloacimonadota bacterium]